MLTSMLSQDGVDRQEFCRPANACPPAALFGTQGVWLCLAAGLMCICGWMPGAADAGGPADEGVAGASVAEIDSDDFSVWIDGQIEAELVRRGLEPEPTVDDAAFLRRVTLDLTGQLPSPEQLAAFVADANPAKRAEWIDRLLSSDEYANHFADLFDAMLMGRREQKRGQREKHGWKRYLRTLFAENRAWDEAVRQMLLARAEGEDRGHLWYLYERDNNHQAIAESVAKSFFGVDIACAQCHDHLVAEEIKQAHYWGLVGFFRRSKNTTTDRGIAIEESAIGGFDDYANPLLGTTESLELTFLLRGVVAEPRPEDPTKQEDSESLYVTIAGEPKVPIFSRREKFVNEILTDHPLLARAMANRLWGLLMGRGLVQPVDQMDSTHEPSHPELLDGLERQFRDSGYDMRALIRAIVLTNAYQRGSKTEKSSVPVDAYAVGIVKPLSAEASVAALQRVLQTPDTPENKERWATVAREWRRLFPEVLPVGEQSTVDQALLLTNGQAFNELLRQAGEHRSQAESSESVEASIQRLYQQCYSRSPSSEELAAVKAYLESRADRRTEGWSQVLWVMVTSAEFRWNH